jgi:hypothetical protein
MMTRGGGLSIVDKFDTILYNLIFNVPKDHLMVSEIGFSEVLSLAQTIGIVGTMVLT